MSGWKYSQSPSKFSSNWSVNYSSVTMKRSASYLFDPWNPKIQLRVMQELNGQSPNDLMKQSISSSNVGAEWRRELKNYMSRKDDVDNVSLSWTVAEDKFWPQRDENCFIEHHSLSSHVKSALGWGNVPDDHSWGWWCSKKKVGDLRHYIQRSF